MIQKFEINNTKDVKQFLYYLIDPQGLNLGMSFHPDDDFADYIGQNGERIFSETDTTTINQKLKECFEVCSKEKTDIYEIAFKYQKAA